MKLSPELRNKLLDGSSISIDLQIDTHIDGHMIHQTTTGPGRHPIQNAREVFSRRVIDTSDAQVREKLIELGWTPPKEQV